MLGACTLTAARRWLDASPALRYQLLNSLPRSISDQKPRTQTAEANAPRARSSVLGVHDEEDPRGDLVVNDRLVVVADNVDSKLLRGNKRSALRRSPKPKNETHDNVLRMQLKDVALRRLCRKPIAVDKGPVRRLDVLDIDLLSLISAVSLLRNKAKRTLPSSLQTSACILLSTLLSKYPFVPFGTVLAFVCRPILTLTPEGLSEICLGTNVSLSGVRWRAGKGAGGEGAAVVAGGAGVAGVREEGGGGGAAEGATGIAGRLSLRIVKLAGE